MSFPQQLHPNKKNYGIWFRYVWRVNLSQVFIVELKLWPLGSLVPKRLKGINYSNFFCIRPVST